ncbi:MFS transporter [Robbsia andropogonis]|uniref:MFS transporter n=1 Tax=Robbsia andropogonis TaxID=28092 RepID=UPI000696F190|nr:MFS transporter [Robbsia andropogonis]
MLERETHLAAGGITAMFGVYGVCAAIGNAIGGKLVDRFGSRSATLTVVIGLAIAMGGACVFAASMRAMVIVMAVWGLASFGAVPVLQNTVINASRKRANSNADVASGTNIAAFNIGIAAGSVIGGIASKYSPYAPTIVALLPLFIAAVLASRLVTRSTSATLEAEPLKN